MQTIKKKIRINYIVDFLAFGAFLITAISGFVMLIFLPSGVKQGRYQEFLGAEKFIWVAIHDWAGIVLTVLVIIHLVLHWRWVVAMSKRFF